MCEEEAGLTQEGLEQLPQTKQPGRLEGLKTEALFVAIADKEVVRDVTLCVRPGEVHVLMGPNGSGKSTLALGIAGHPRYATTKGSVSIAGQSLNGLTPDARARLGLFVGFQYPQEVPGVPLGAFLRRAVAAAGGEERSVLDFHVLLRREMAALGLDSALAQRGLNEGFSGGEKKRNEVLQALILRPKVAILDEPDSGLDVDGVRQVGRAVAALAKQGAAVLAITHYPAAVTYLRPQFVHLMVSGSLVESGDVGLATVVARHGFEHWRKGADRSGH